MKYLVINKRLNLATLVHRNKAKPYCGANRNFYFLTLALNKFKFITSKLILRLLEEGFLSLTILRCILTVKNFEHGLIAVQLSFENFDLGRIAVQTDFQNFRAWPYSGAN